MTSSSREWLPTGRCSTGQLPLTPVNWSTNERESFTGGYSWQASGLAVGPKALAATRRALCVKLGARARSSATALA